MIKGKNVVLLEDDNESGKLSYDLNDFRVEGDQVIVTTGERNMRYDDWYFERYCRVTIDGKDYGGDAQEICQQLQILVTF